MVTLIRSFVLKFVGVPQPKPMHGFLPNFQDVFTLELIKVLGISGKRAYFKYFSVFYFLIEKGAPIKLMLLPVDFYFLPAKG